MYATGEIVIAWNGSIAQITGKSEKRDDVYHVKILKPKRHHKEGDHLVWNTGMFN